MLKRSLFDQGPPPECPSPFNLADYVLSASNVPDDKTALEVLFSSHREIWSYKDLRSAVLSTAGGLKALGLPDGSRILLRIGNHIDFPLFFLGAIVGGYVPVPSSSQLTAFETRNLIDDLDPTLVVFGEGAEYLDDISCATVHPGQINELRGHAPIKPILGDPERLAYIIYTSGTSGKPRAVMHAHRAIWARRMMWEGWYGLTGADRLLHAGAFNWTYTLGTGLLDPWSIGATALIPDSAIDRSALPGLIAESKASIFAAAPGVYRQMLKSGDTFDFQALRHGLSAGEKLPPTLRQQWFAQTGTPVFEALGMSEVSTFISQNPAEKQTDGASGKPQHGRRVAVLGKKTLEPTKINAPGILAVSKRDPGLMLGYRNAVEKTNSRFSDEWFLTGDMVKMDPMGNVTYLGRDDDMMSAQGYRVSPIEVEVALNQFSDIQESAVTAIEVKPDTFVIAAFYQSDIELDESILVQYCAERLARYKCPRLFIKVDELPRGANNKIKRAELRKRYKVQE